MIKTTQDQLLTEAGLIALELRLKNQPDTASPPPQPASATGSTGLPAVPGHLCRLAALTPAQLLDEAARMALVLRLQAKEIAEATARITALQSRVAELAQRTEQHSGPAHAAPPTGRKTA